MRSPCAGDFFHSSCSQSGSHPAGGVAAIAVRVFGEPAGCVLDRRSCIHAEVRESLSNPGDMRLCVALCGLIISQLGVGLVGATTALQRSQARLERSTAELLDALEAQCLTPAPFHSSDSTRPTVSVAAAALKRELRSHYTTTGAFDSPVQREVCAYAGIVADMCVMNIY
jgi:hypothetical protein